MLQGYMVGRLGKNAELKKTKEGISVCSFSLACQQGFGDRAKTLWVDCAVWGERGEKLTEFLTKGREVAVTGELGVRAWWSEQKGEAGASIQLNVRELTLLGDAVKKQNAA